MLTEIEWTWLTDVLGVPRPSAPADDAALTLRATEEDDTARNDDSPINTAAFPSETATTPVATPTPPPTPTPTPTAGPAPVMAQAQPAPVDPAKAPALAKMAAIVARFNAVADPWHTAPMIAASKAFMAAYKTCKGLLDTQKYTEAAALLDDLDQKLRALEALVADLPKLQKATDDEAATIKAMSDKDVAKLATADRAEMIKTLLAAGKPTGDARAMQIRLYTSCKLDPKFMKDDEDRGKLIAKDLKGDKELKAARKGWKTASEGDKLKALRKIVAVQSKVFGIPPPDMVIEHKPPANGLVTNGYFDPQDGKLHINMDPQSSVQNFQRAVDLALHENAHNWQAHLVEDLKSGKLKKGDKNYDQALMFAVNETHPGGYITGEENYAAYKKQPMEDHSWTTGPKTAQKIMKVI